MIGLAGQYIFFGGKIRVEFVLNCVFGALAAITGKESSTGCLKDLFRTRLRDLQPYWVGKRHELGVYATHSVRILGLWK